MENEPPQTSTNVTARKPSVFEQRMKMLQEKREPRSSREQSSFARDRTDYVAGVQMDIVRSENEALLKSLSIEEIKEKQQELLRTLSPANIAFLKNRTAGKKEGQQSSSSPSNEVGMDLGSEIEEVQPDTVEREKLKWMEDVPTDSKSLSNTLYSARFDFKGTLLPFVVKDESTCSKGLYHHGKEPERPGYTLEELFQLSRSSFPRQRVVALNTIAAILENEFSLSSEVETELLPELLNSGIFLILRFALDERLKAVYLAALKAMSALFWRAADMHYLTETIGVFGDISLPSFEVNHSALDSANEKEMKDSELITLDVVRGALRTNLVQRLKFILDDMFPVDDRIFPIMKCLTRLAYHSEEIARVIVDTPLLLEKLFAICKLPSESGKLHTAKLLTLFRVIACRSQELTEILNARFHLVPHLLSVICDPVTKTSTVSQCIYLWHVLLHRGIATESVSEFSAALFTLLRQLVDRSAKRLKEGEIVLANALVTLLIFLFDEFPETVTFLRTTVEHLGGQWLNLFFSGEQDSRNFVKLISNSFYLLTCTKVAEPTTITSLLKIVKWERLISTSKSLREDSYLLNAVKVNYAESLPSLCLPTCILIADNNIILTHAIVKHLLRSGLSNCDHSSTLIENLWQFYVLPVLKRVDIKQIATFWPARFEIAFLCDILFLSARQTNLSIQQQKWILGLAFAVLPMVHTDDSALVKRIFNDILFNEHLHERITSSHFQGDAATESTAKYLDAVKLIFATQLNLPNVKSDLSSTKRGTESALPTDWFYVPILKISNAFQDNDGRRSESYENAGTIGMMDHILRWIRFVEYVADDMSMDMTVSTRFCRVCCIFFCGDAFLELRHLLADILRLLLKHNDELEFRTPIPGLSSFYDFYRDLCEQFAGCSYGDQVFGAYVLVPLQQKHDVRLRMYFWSEQTVALRFFTTTVEYLFVPFSCYLQHNEKNVELVETYLNVIARGHVNEKRNPVLYHIGMHHIASFLQSQENESITQRLRQKVDRIADEHLKNCILNYNYSDGNLPVED